MAAADWYVRPAQLEDRERLVDLWERSVRATHHFLEDRDVRALRPLVAEELASPSIGWWVLASSEEKLMGFLAFANDAIEGLFVDPDYIRRGAGRLLVAHAQSLAADVLRVDVNEQNTAAVAFYERMGFQVVGRSPLDTEGRPFPLLHMERALVR